MDKGQKIINAKAEYVRKEEQKRQAEEQRKVAEAERIDAATKVDVAVGLIAGIEMVGDTYFIASKLKNAIQTKVDEVFEEFIGKIEAENITSYEKTVPFVATEALDCDSVRRALKVACAVKGDWEIIAKITELTTSMAAAFCCGNADGYKQDVKWLNQTHLRIKLSCVVNDAADDDFTNAIL